MGRNREFSALTAIKIAHRLLVLQVLHRPRSLRHARMCHSVVFHILLCDLSNMQIEIWFYIKWKTCFFFDILIRNLFVSTRYRSPIFSRLSPDKKPPATSSRHERLILVHFDAFGPLVQLLLSQFNTKKTWRKKGWGYNLACRQQRPLNVFFGWFFGRLDPPFFLKTCATLLRSAPYCRSVNVSGSSGVWE